MGGEGSGRKPDIIKMMQTQEKNTFVNDRKMFPQFSPLFMGHHLGFLKHTFRLSRNIKALHTA